VGSLRSLHIGQTGTDTFKIGWQFIDAHERGVGGQGFLDIISKGSPNLGFIAFLLATF
jgi:hypothetical protein